MVRNLGSTSLDEHESRRHHIIRQHQCLENKRDSDPRCPTAKSSMCFVGCSTKIKDAFERRSDSRRIPIIAFPEAVAVLGLSRAVSSFLIDHMESVF